MSKIIAQPGRHQDPDVCLSTALDANARTGSRMAAIPVIHP